MTAYYTTPLPTVSVTPGPTWATTLNTILTLVENHAHTGSDEQRITPAAMTINADVNFATNRALALKSARFTPATLPAGGSNANGFLVDASGNLYYENSSGTQIQISSGGVLLGTGTATTNGFYAGGGTGYAGIAAMAYDQTLLEFKAFNNVSSIGTGTYTGLATDVALGFRAISASSPINALFAQNTSKQTGFLLRGLGSTGGGASFVFDVAAGGTYGIEAFAIRPASYADSTAPVYCFNYNSPSIETSWATNIWQQGKNAASSHVAHTYFSWRTGTGTGTAYVANDNPDLGSSYDVQFRAEYGAAASGNYGAMARIVPFWTNTSTPKGGLVIQTGRNVVGSAAWNGSAYINLNDNLSGIGFGGIAIGNNYAFYHPIVPPSDAGTDVGTSSLHFNNVYATTVSASGALTLVGSSISIGNQVNLTAGASIVPSATGANNLGSNALRYKSVFVGNTAASTGSAANGGAYLASPAFVPTTALDLTARHAANNIVAFVAATVSGTTPSITQFWNVTTLVNASTGVWTLTFSVPININALIMCSGSGGDQVWATGTMTSTTTATINTKNAGGPSNLVTGFNIIVVGQPDGTI